MHSDLNSHISLEGQTALVTGGSRGIGQAVALTLARAGAWVAINYRSGETEARNTLAAIEREGGQGTLLPFDVSDSQAVNESLGELLKQRESLEILVNNAGIARDGLVGRMKDEAWNDVIGANLSGAFYLCRAASKSMIRKRRGRIVNMASTAGEIGNPGQANYSAAKAGLIGLTKSLARELAPRNILVNAVSPGIIVGGLSDHLSEAQQDTILELVPLKRMGSAMDVASAVLFLCSGLSEYVTGQVIRVNGGLYV